MVLDALSLSSKNAFYERGWRPEQAALARTMTKPNIQRPPNYAQFSPDGAKMNAVETGNRRRCSSSNGASVPIGETGSGPSSDPLLTRPVSGFAFRPYTEAFEWPSDPLDYDRACPAFPQELNGIPERRVPELRTKQTLENNACKCLLAANRLPRRPLP